MRSLAFLGLLTSVALIPAPVAAQSESGAAAPNAAVALAAQGMRGAHRMRGNYRMRGNHGMRRMHRGNFRSFHRGTRYFGSGARFYTGGFVPRYYLAPRYYVINWAHYGLGQPGFGHRWVRHYDDAYLVDQYGRVSDSRYGVGYDGDRDYDERYDDDRGGGNAGDTVAGAIAGGVIGGVAGNLIAGEGDRTEGTIIGAAVGAIAGGAIGNAAGRNDRRGGYDDRYYDDRVPEYVGDGDFYPPAAPGYGQPGNPYLGYQNASTVQTTVTVNGVTTHASQTVGGMTQSSTTTVVTGGCCGPRTTVVTTPQGRHAHHQRHPHTRAHHAQHPHPHSNAPRDPHPHTAQHHAQHPHPHGPTPAAYAPDQPLPGPAPQLDVPNPPEPTINFIEETVN